MIDIDEEYTKELIRVLRDEYRNAPKTMGKREAWIVAGEWGVGVRYYPVNSVSKGMTESVDGGYIKLIEKL